MRKRTSLTLWHRLTMQATFHNAPGVTRADLNRLSQRNNRAAIVRLVLQVVLLVTSAALVVALADGPRWGLSLAVGACGLLITTCFAPLHESAHLTAFSSRRLNASAGWLAGLPLLFPPVAYREFHFEHHRHTHDPERDPEISAGGERFAMWPVYAHEYFAVASGLLLLGLRVVMLLSLAIGPSEWLWKKLLPFVRRHARQEAVRQARIYLVIYVAFAAAAAAWAPGAIWLIASLVVGHAALALYLASEHTGLPMQGTIFDRTRTTLTNRVVRYFMWNMPYHAEHHAYPSVPFHALPELHLLAQQELRHTASGYLRLHGGVVSGLQWLRRPKRRSTKGNSTYSASRN